MALAALALTWLAVFIKAPGAWRADAPPARRALWTALFALALGWTLRVPAGYRGFDEFTHVPNLSQLAGDVLALTTACAILGMLLYQTNEAPQALRKLRARVGALGATAVSMAVTFFLAPVGQETTEFFEQYAHEPLIGVYILTYLGFVGYAFWDLTRLSRRFAHVSDRRSLTTGLRLIQAAGVLGLVYVTLRLGYLAAVWVDSDDRLGAYDLVSKTLVATLSLLAVVGAVLPAVAGRVEMYRAYRQLYPLWAALYHSTPGIALSPPSRVRELLSFFSARQLQFGLRSRIIEIRDGRLAPRAYFRRDVAERADRLARRNSLTEEELAATVEAATLAAAMEDKAQGRKVAASAVTSGPAPGAADLAGEVSWLRQVTRAYTRSRVVRDSLHHGDH